MRIGDIQFTSPPVVLAPMEDVTDLAFRLVCKRRGADIVYTEFVSSEGLIRDIREAVAKLKILEEERPIGIQIYGNRVASMVQAAKIAEAAGPDILDINYGCPSKHVAGSGAGSGLLKTPELMEEITRAVVNAVNIPVTAKTRLGWCDSEITIVEIAKMLESCGIQALTIHGRTRTQKFKGQADWGMIGEAKKAVKIPVFGNGDVICPEDVQRMLTVAGVDGVMIGRGSYGNPWIFERSKHFLRTGVLLPHPSLDERVEVLLEHLDLSIQLKGERRGILEMGKHYGNYFHGLRNVKYLKARLRDLKSYQEIQAAIFEFIADYNNRHESEVDNALSPISV
jgi:tRNA-dihydrouridine synthase B